MLPHTISKPWPFLIYDRWTAFLRLQMERLSLEVDTLSVLQQPPYAELMQGDHFGILFGTEGPDEYPHATEGVFQLWLDRLQPDCPFDLDFLAEAVARARMAGIGEPGWSPYEERMSLSRKRPLRHPAPVSTILAETRGFLFYRDQPARILALVLDLDLHAVKTLLNSHDESKSTQCSKLEFIRRLVEFSANEREATALWNLCRKRYRFCHPREYLDARRAQILWALAVRSRYPKLFQEAWKTYAATLSKT